MLPKFFKLSKIASFQRQLNLYGFVRLTAGLDKSGYYHERFLRERPDLLWTIPRAKVKGTKVRAKSNPAAEPNFWDMDWVGVTASSQNGQQNKRQFSTVAPPTTLKTAAIPDPPSSSSTFQQQRQQQQQQQRSEAERTQSLSVVSALGDDFDHHSMSDEEDEPVDFFDQLLNDMFDSEQAYDFDALQRRLVPQF